MVIEIKNALDGHISRLNTPKNRICELEDGAIEITQNETQRKKSKTIKK